LRSRSNIGFLFVGRGSDAQLLRDEAIRRELDNVVFYDEIAPEEIPGLYAQCHVGIVALDPRHKTHNIPGKFLTYMQSGLPVLASINTGNDLIQIIEDERVGRVCTDHSVNSLEHLATQLVDEVQGDADMPVRCKALCTRLFAPDAVTNQRLNRKASQ
jgi:glycosyltransferase involved in cell wall biosynthesis